jgi:hypothetical protein
MRIAAPSESTDMPDIIRRLSEDVSRYTREHGELALARWFSFDEPLAESVQYIFMDTYPSESAAEQSLAVAPCRQRPSSGFVAARHEQIRKFLSHDQVACGYHFFWSARNTHQFKKRFGTGFTGSSHLEFCRDVNLKMFDHYRPKAIISNGVSTASTRIARLYSLKLLEIKTDQSKSILVKQFSDGIRPWLFVKHLSGSFGYTKEQRQAVQSYVRDHIR